MKKQAAIFFLVLLALPAIYKVGLFTFFQLNRQYIAENYCVNKDRPITMCYGQCFLVKGMELADATPNPDSLVSQLKFESSEFLVVEVTLPYYKTLTLRSFSMVPTPSLSEGVASFVFRPPLA